MMNFVSGIAQFRVEVKIVFESSRWTVTLIKEHRSDKQCRKLKKR